VVMTLVVEFVIVWAVFLPRPFRLVCAAIVTALQVGIIATANYAFLNYLVLMLGVLLLDDAVFARWSRSDIDVPAATGRWPLVVRRAEVAVLGVVFYATVVAFFDQASSSLVALPARLLAPFRIANAYGLFAVMTEARYEIEFQGSRDGVTWISYPFRYKPQDPDERPRIYAPYQPRFEWNLWFASLGPWEQSQWVVLAQQRLVEGSPDVLKLFRSDPFHGRPPAMVRTVLWQYWFTDASTKRGTGLWWRRRDLGPFTGTLTRGRDGGWILESAPTRLAPLNVTAPASN
jgi:lipase maturation factor 1